MTNTELSARLIELSRNPTPEFLKIKERWEGSDFSIRVNGKWRPEGAITWLLSQYEQCRCADPSLPPLPRPELFEPQMLNRIFGIPLEACGVLTPLKGKPGRPNTTKDLADFAHERRPQMAWKDIYIEWKGLFPNDDRDVNTATFIEAHRRHYRCPKPKGV